MRRRADILRARSLFQVDADGACGRHADEREAVGVRQAEGRVAGAQVRLAAGAAHEPLPAYRGAGDALEDDAERHVGRQAMPALARIAGAQGARAVVGGESRQVALQRLQRRRRRFQIDEPQLDHARATTVSAIARRVAARRARATIARRDS